MTPWTVAWQAPLPMGLPRQEYWSKEPLPLWTLCNKHWSSQLNLTESCFSHHRRGIWGCLRVGMLRILSFHSPDHLWPPRGSLARPFSLYLYHALQNNTIPLELGWIQENLATWCFSSQTKARNTPSLTLQDVSMYITSRCRKVNMPEAHCL